jgi:hypothetical protein
LATVIAIAVGVGMLPSGPVGAARGAPERVSGCRTAAGIDVASGPAGAASWTTTRVRTLGDYGNDGGLAVADDQHATVVTMDNEVSWAIPTSDGGATWDPRVRLTGVGWRVQSSAVAQRGLDVDVANAAFKSGTDRILVRHSPDGGVSWGPTVKVPGVVFYPVIARGTGGLVIVTSSPDPAVRVWISRDGGATFGKPVRIGAYKPGPGCAYEPGRTGIAITGKVVLVAHWKSPTRLILHRSTDRGRTWAPAVTLRSGAQGQDTIGMAVAGSEVLLAFRSGPDLLTRLSTDRGATWSPPTAFKAGGFGFALARADGAWRIAYQRGSALRYRSSATGRSWSAEQTVATIPAADDATPVGVGVVGGGPVVPWVHVRSSSDDEALEWSARS